MFQFGELDDVTRRYMLEECERDIGNDALYLGVRLSDAGKTAYPQLLREAIQGGNERTLAQALGLREYWLTHETRIRAGKPIVARVPSNAAEVLAEGEFNVFYMRGLCRRLLDEGETQAEAYRAKAVVNPREGERVNPGDKLSCQEVLDDLRTREEGVSRTGIPRGPASGLSLRRITGQRSRHVE